MCANRAAGSTAGSPLFGSGAAGKKARAMTRSLDAKCGIGVFKAAFTLVELSPHVLLTFERGFGLSRKGPSWECCFQRAMG